MRTVYSRVISLLDVNIYIKEDSRPPEQLTVTKTKETHTAMKTVRKTVR